MFQQQPARPQCPLADVSLQKWRESSATGAINQRTTRSLCSPEHRASKICGKFSEYPETSILRNADETTMKRRNIDKPSRMILLDRSHPLDESGERIEGEVAAQDTRIIQGSGYRRFLECHAALCARY